MYLNLISLKDEFICRDITVVAWSWDPVEEKVGFERGMRKPWEVMEMFTVWIVLILSLMHTCVKTSQNI